MRILGVDPGTTGALAIFDELKTPASGLRWLVADLPTITVQPKSKGSNKHTKLNIPAFRDWVRKYAPDLAVVEAMQFAAPGKDGGKKGLAGAMRYGELFGSVVAVLACCDTPIEFVQPINWKKRFGLLKSEKELSRLKALQLFPTEGASLDRKKDQNRAEAMLIAFYGSERYHVRLAVDAAE